MKFRSTVKQGLIRNTPKWFSEWVIDFYIKVRFRTVPRIRGYSTVGDVLNCVVAYNELGGYCIPQNSIQRPAAQAVMRGEVWEKETIDYIAKQVSGGDVVHGGMYFGDFLPGLSKALADGAKVWAFEPNFDNYSCAKITQAINRLNNVEMFNAGMGEKDTVAKMHTRSPEGVGLGGSSTILRSSTSLSDSQLDEVAILAIDSVLPESRNVDVIQLDVEGYEKEALSGALKTIERCKPVLIIEVPPSEEWMENNILNLGYVRDGDVQGNSIYRCRTPSEK